MKKRVKRLLEHISELTAEYQLYQQLSTLSEPKREVYLHNQTYCDRKINEASKKILPVLLSNWTKTPSNEKNRVIKATEEHAEVLEGALDKIKQHLGA